MECLSAVYTPRHYVIADTDMMSEEKISTFESSKRHSDSEPQVRACVDVGLAGEVMFAPVSRHC